MATFRVADYLNKKVRLKSWKGDYLHRPDQPQGVTTWGTGIGNEWTVEAGDGGTIRLKSWKGDYLHRTDQPQGVTSAGTGSGNDWTIEPGEAGKVRLKSSKTDYLHRPDQPQGVTTWGTGIGNEWTLELVEVAKRNFIIHPGIGVARMGNSPDGFFIGPETPGVFANWNDDKQGFNSFRDSQGRILRQGARFRVFEYDEVNSQCVNFREVAVGGDVKDIEWRVHLANRKASFYVFDGQNGAKDNYVERSTWDPHKKIKDPEEPGVGDPVRTNLRNAGVPAAERAAKLEIDPGEKLIKASQGGDVELANPNKAVPIKSLGTLKVDAQGRLIVLGGYGQSASTATPPVPIDEYASNDTWFDDASDGSVKARVRLSDGTFVDAVSAWVMVGPPDFAPGVGNVVSLYDTIWDVAVRSVKLAPKSAGSQSPAMNRLREQKEAWAVKSTTPIGSCKPSFTQDIYPLLKRALGARDVHVSGVTNPQYHKTMMDWDKLSDLTGANAKEGKILRGYVFQYMRNPDATELNWKQMPRGLGDEYTQFDSDTGPVPTSLFSLTRVQYWHLQQWAAGNFINDWKGTEPHAKVNPAPTPDELDKAAADNSVGGPFFPGIDVSWLIRCPDLYNLSFPLRFDYPSQPEAEVKSPAKKIGALEFQPGFFSQQMALPWQADFYDCHKERKEDPDGNEFYFMWWTAHRPDDVFPSGKDKQERWVRLFDSRYTYSDPVFEDPDVEKEPDAFENLERFDQMQKNWHELKFITARRGDHWEEEK